MSKTLIFADAHIHPHKRSSDRLDHCIEALDWVFATALDRGIKDVIFLGDLFHDRQKIDVLTYQRTFEVFEKYLCGKGEYITHFEAEIYQPPFNLFLLLGNHDLWHLLKCDVSSVNPLRQLPGLNIINEPCAMRVGNQLIGFLPYTHNPIADLKIVEDSFQKLLKSTSLSGNDKKFLCGHVAVDGALWNAKYGTTSEVTIEHDGDMVQVGPEIFDGWDRVFLGHYHAEQKLTESVEYVGSPLQLSFGEAFQKKHILIYDFKTGESEYVENEFSPKHYIVKESELDKYSLSGNFIRVVVDDISASSMIEMRRDLIENKQVGSLEIKQMPKEEEHIVIDAKAILYKESEMLEKYVEQVEIGDLEKPKLLGVGAEICEFEEDLTN